MRSGSWTTSRPPAAIRTRCAAAPAAGHRLMVAYAYDTINRGNPAGFFGMVSCWKAPASTSPIGPPASIQENLGLPDTAFRYLTSTAASTWSTSVSSKT